MPRATLPPRNEVPVEETWNLESIFPSVDAWEAAYEEAKGQPNCSKFFDPFPGNGPIHCRR